MVVRFRGDVRNVSGRGFICRWWQCVERLIVVVVHLSDLDL